MNRELRERIERYNRGRRAPARLEYYLKAAQARKEPTNDEAKMIRILEDSIQTAQQAIFKNDIDDLLQAFERVIRLTVELNLPEHDKVMERANQKKRNANRVKNFKEKELRAIKLYENGNWNSPRAASIEFAKDLGAKQRTIYGWLLKRDKNKT